MRTADTPTDHRNQRCGMSQPTSPTKMRAGHDHVLVEPDVARGLDGDGGPVGVGRRIGKADQPAEAELGAEVAGDAVPQGHAERGPQDRGREEELRVREERGEHRSSIAPQPQPCHESLQTRRHQSCLVAIAAPWASVSSFAQAICGCTRPPRPQSVAAMTFSRPTSVGEAHDAVGDELGVLDDVGGVADDAGQDQLAVGQLGVLPDAPFVLVADVAGLEGVGAGVDLEHDVDDVAHRDVGRVRAVPAAPAEVEADAILGRPLSAWLSASTAAW